MLAMSTTTPAAAMAEDADRLRARDEEAWERLAVAGSREERAEVHEAVRAERRAFLDRHAGEVYESLTDGLTRELSVADLVGLAAERFPGLVPAPARMAAEREHRQADKDGLEIDHGLFLSSVLGSPRSGLHLVNAMLRPRPDSLARLDEFRREGAVDLGLARVERRGGVGTVELRNERFLNAEDDEATAALERGVDLVLLHPDVEVGVLRGSVATHRRYAGRRVFNSGINLTHLYWGQISLVDFFVNRELGLLGKIQRGLWTGGDGGGPGLEGTAEKPWIAAVESHAIGGGCQLLLIMDRVLAERGALLNLPARKEGIIPGLANLRLPRFVGERAARQAIMFGRDFRAGDEDAAGLVDGVVDPEHPDRMDEAIERDAAQLTSAGAVSASANRKALRLGQEPVDVFRTYLALYVREQARCIYAPALISNLENNWQAHERKP
jgi:thioesterase DpgC